ncbi:hypothetical protein SASPL_122325 [Salvia splendens]|uniref:Amino acid transporter transmembrane domain-containing protein n=1 Tax=Salvia splendens TaxID=180675 RepID=A0A8X8XP36_SALSN|nr:hypothetical protein SASPL_122325 [Salvia splendens]
MVNRGPHKNSSYRIGRINTSMGHRSNGLGLSPSSFSHSSLYSPHTYSPIVTDGTRNYIYKDAVKNYLGVTIGYSITTAFFVEIVLSQVPNFHELAFLSYIAAIMSFGYATIGLSLSIAKVAEGRDVTTSITGKGKTT